MNQRVTAGNSWQWWWKEGGGGHHALEGKFEHNLICAQNAFDFGDFCADAYCTLDSEVRQGSHQFVQLQCGRCCWRFRRARIKKITLIGRQLHNFIRFYLPLPTIYLDFVNIAGKEMWCWWSTTSIGNLSSTMYNLQITRPAFEANQESSPTANQLLKTKTRLEYVLAKQYLAVWHITQNDALYLDSHYFSQAPHM